MGCKCGTNKRTIRPRVLELSAEQLKAQPNEVEITTKQLEVINLVPIQEEQQESNESHFASKVSATGGNRGNNGTEELNALDKDHPAEANVYESAEMEAVGDYKENNQFNTVVWASSSEELAWYNENSVHTVHLAKYSTTVHYCFFPITSVDCKKVPGIVDCVILLVQNIEKDNEQIQKVLKTFKSVWVKKLLCTESSPELLEYSESYSIRLSTDLHELLQGVYEDDRKIYHLIKEVFKKIDSDDSNEVDIKELALAAQMLGQSIEQEDIEKAMHSMDFNYDGMISLQEFIYWWKRGRQGAKSVNKLVGQWAHTLAFTVPGSIEVLRCIRAGKKTITKAVARKSLTVKIGPVVQNPGFSVSFMVGKSSMRESIVQSINTTLEYYSRDSWVAVVLSSKGNEVSCEACRKLNELLTSQFNLAMGATVRGEELQQHCGFNMGKDNDKVYLGFWFDMFYPSLYKHLDKLIQINDIWLTPVDDSMELELKFNAAPDTFLTSQGLLVDEGVQVEIQLSHWANLVKIFEAMKISELKALYALSFTGQGSVSFEDSKKLPHWLQSKLGALNPLAVLRPFFSSALMFPSIKRLLQSEFRDEIEIYSRFLNFGVTVKLCGQGLMSTLSMLSED